MGLRRRRRRRLLRGRVPRGHARRRRRPRRGRRAGARGRHRHRAAHGRRLPRAAGRARPRRARSTRRSSTGRSCARSRRRRSSACSTPTPSRTSRRRTIDLDSPAAPRAGPPPRRGVGRAAVERRRAAAPAADAPARVAVVGPNARPRRGAHGLLLVRQPRARAPPRAAARLRDPDRARGASTRRSTAPALTRPELVFAEGCTVEGDDTSGFAEAVAAAEGADVAVVVVGDQAGLFGRGTVGEGNDVESLDLPGVQRELVEALVATGTPVVMVLLTGRPYAIGWALDGAGARPGAVLQAFFPGRGRRPGRSPTCSPARSTRPAGCRLAAALGRRAAVLLPAPDPRRSVRRHVGRLRRRLRPVRLRPLVHVVRVRRPRRSTPTVGVERDASPRRSPSPTPVPSPAPTSSSSTGTTCRARSPGPSCSCSATRASSSEPGASRRVTFRVPTTRFAFSDRRMVRVVEPGDVEVWVGSHAAASRAGTGVSESTGGVISNARRSPSAARSRARRRPARVVAHHRRRARGHRRRPADRWRSRSSTRDPGPQPAPARLLPRPVDLPRRGRLLPRHLDVRVPPGPAGVPQPRPRRAGSRSATSSTGPASSTTTGIASSGGLYAPTMRHHDGRFWLVCTLVDQQRRHPRRQLPHDRDRPGRTVVGAGVARRRRHRPVDLLRRRRPRLGARHPAGRASRSGTTRPRSGCASSTRRPMALVGPGARRLERCACGTSCGPRRRTCTRSTARTTSSRPRAAPSSTTPSRVARADAVTGPYVGNKGNPVLTHRHLGRGSRRRRRRPRRPRGGRRTGAGGRCCWRCVPTAATTTPSAARRSSCPVEWEDGWPVFAPGVGRVAREVEVPVRRRRRVPAWPRAPSSGTVAPDDLRWTSLRAPASRFATPRGEGWDLPAAAEHARRRRGRRRSSGCGSSTRDVDVRATLRATLGPGEEAGLTVRQSEKHHARLSVTGTGAGRTRGRRPPAGRRRVDPRAGSRCRATARWC